MVVATYLPFGPDMLVAARRGQQYESPRISRSIGGANTNASPRATWRRSDEPREPTPCRARQPAPTSANSTSKFRLGKLHASASS